MSVEQCMKSIRFHCGWDLRASRAKAGLTQQQLADKAGVHVQSVKYWERQTDRELYGGLYGKAIDKMADSLGLVPIGLGFPYCENRTPPLAMQKWLEIEWAFAKPSTDSQ